MKKTLSLLALCSAAAAYAQEPADALRFSYTAPSGTARHQAIGGAMGSLGGDVTATFVNPAGLGFYKTGDFVLTPSYRFGNNTAGYFGRKEKATQKKLEFGTSGVVWATGNNTGTKRGTAISLAFNTTGDFKRNILYRGINNQSSYSQKYLEEIRNAGIKDGNVVANDFAFGTSLAFTSLWIDTVGGGTNGNFQFQSRSVPLLSSGLIQEQSVTSRGGNYETSLGVAVNYNDKLMLGGSLSMPYLFYERASTFTEADQSNNAGNGFDFATVTERLTTSGLGLNVKAGLIYKPQEFWRLGLAIHSPTLYSLTDEQSAEITANVERGAGAQTDYSSLYPDQSPEFRYMMTTPYKVIGSVSYVLREIQDVTKQRGFLTADIEYINYKSSSYQPESSDETETTEEGKAYLRSLNKAIDNAYKGAFNFRAGGELKFTTLMVRLGAAYYGNPYKDIAGEKGSRLNLSGGLGYRDKGRFIDLTYVHSMNKDVHLPYRLQNGLSPRADIRTTAGNVVLTFGIKI
ncbi:MAG TPA: aromatic hydrocarbon degradation protein [Flavisolibacter sp.]|nr:aromatic hydrocarbon degradation protein [Flavisolibacter sp.]